MLFGKFASLPVIDKLESYCAEQKKSSLQENYSFPLFNNTLHGDATIVLGFPYVAL